MVYFKYFGLPLLVGLMLCKKAYATCSITTTDGTAITVDDRENCSNGYYLLTYTPEGGSETIKMIGYTKGENELNDTKTAISEAGYYYDNNAGKHYVCTSSTACTEFQPTTVGYYKVGNNYVGCSSKNKNGGLGDCVLVGTISETCGETTVGKFVQISGNNYGLCLAEYEVGETKKYPTLGFLASAQTDDDLYFVKHVPNTDNDTSRIFNFDIEMNYYIVKHTDKEIILEKPSEAITNECALAESSKKIGRKDDFCGVGSGRYFTCSANSGKCKSYLQSSYDVQELNNEKCMATSTENTFKGNCKITIASSLEYYLVNNGEIISNTSNGEIVQLSENHDGTFSYVGSPISTKGYYLNADVATKQIYPLILCDNGCKFVSSETVKAGYYITNSEDVANVIKCKAPTSCEIAGNGINIGNVKIESSKISLVGNEDYKFNYKDGVDKEYLLLDVGVGEFPGVTSVGNYAVQMTVEKGDSIGTILLLEKKTSCTDAEDNEIVKKDDGKFYYCAGGVEVPLSSRAKFAITKNNEVKLIELSASAVKEIVIKIDNKDENLGYYVDRSKGATGLVYCSSYTEEEGGSQSTKYKCESKAPNMKDDYEVFINQELGFPGSNGVALDAKIIICSSEKCSVPEKSGSKYKYGDKELSNNDYFINHEDDPVESLIKCDTINSSCRLITEDHLLTEGIYINGIKDLSLIKCIEKEKSDGEDGNTTYISCETMSSVTKYGHYNSHDITKYIECNNDKCEEKDGEEGKTFINSDEESEKLIITCSSGSSCGEIEAGDYYVDSSLGGLNLLKCGENGCIKVEGKNRGVYISDNGSKLISCDTSSCSVIAGSGSIGGEKEAYYLNGDSTADSPIITSIIKEDTSATSRKRAIDNFKWAPMEEKINQYDVFLNGNTNNNKYGIIYCSSETSCTEIADTNGNYYINLISETSIIIDCSGVKCSSSPTDGDNGDTSNYIIDKSTSKIIASGTGSLVQCTYSDSKWSCGLESENTYYISTAIGELTGNELFISTGNEYTIKSAADMTENGYFFNSDTNVYKCDGTNACAKVNDISDTKKCSTANVGEVVVGGEICLHYKDESDYITQSRDSNKIYVSKVKSFPGVTPDSIIFISTAGSKVVQLKPLTDAYYLIGSDLSPITTESEVGKVYKYIKSSGNVELLSQTDTTYYPNSDENTLQNYSNIKCERVKDEEKSTDTKIEYKIECKLSKKSADDVYCLKKGTTKLYSCPKSCDSTECYEIVHKSGYYLPYEKTNLISCTSTACSTSKPNAAGYYRSEDANNSLIICNKSADGYRCTYEENVIDGYYVGAEKNIIQCKSGICKVVTNTNGGWYKSGESNKVITYCTGTNTNLSCTSDSKPAVGYYKNGGDTPLIKCTADNNGNVSCAEIAIPNEGYFLNASNKDENKILIKCINGTCEEDVVDTNNNGYNYYFVNGVNNKLIYCKDRNNCVETEGTGWFVNGEGSDKAIFCDVKCVNRSSSEVKKGYYLNASPFIVDTYKPLLYNSGVYFAATIIKESGWYINSGSTSNSDKIIECIYGIIPYCSTKAVTTDCTNGRFFVDSVGVVKWCINGNSENLVAKGEDKRYVYANIPSKNFFSWIPESTGYVKFKIGELSVTQEMIDGYSYDSVNSNLYFCSKYGSGICTPIKSTDITPGYYINYSENSIIICGKYEGIVCQNIPNSALTSADSYNRYDIVVGTEDGETNHKLYLYPVNTESDPVIMENITTETLYAITNVKSKAFPRPADKGYARYILVDANKYYVKFRENIDEVESCGEDIPRSDETDNTKVCLANSGNNYELLNVKTGNKLSSSSIPVSNTYRNVAVEYDADTNDGYFTYESDTNNNHVLVEVYIKKVDSARVEFKYQCPINGICIRREKAKEPVLGYQFENGIMKKQTRNQSSSNEIVDEKIMPGVYIKYDGTQNDDKEVISCDYDVNKVVVCKTMSRSSSGISGYNKNTKTISISNSLTGNIQSSKLFNKLIINRIKRNFKRSLEKRDDAGEVLILKELSSTSYSESTFDALTNVFLNSEYKKITNEVLTSDEEKTVKGYTCNSLGECVIIDKSGNAKYFLNSGSSGTKNAIVVCGSGRCRFIDAVNGNVYENYAATSIEDALIICNSNGCRTDKIQNTGSLPTCQKNVLGNIAKDEITEGCISAETSKTLLDGQHCISNGVIYLSNKGCEAISKRSMILFDATFREIEINSKLIENHYGATLYNCPVSDGGCYVTYGYIVNISNSATGYSLCNKNGCIFKSIDTLKTNCNEAGKGGLAVDNNYIKLCKSDNSSSNTVGYYPIPISINENFPGTIFGDNILVNVETPATSVSVFSLVLNDGYIFTSTSDNKILNNNNKPNNLVEFKTYKCESSTRTCIVIDEPEYGYYRSASYPDDIFMIGENANKKKVLSYDTSISLKFTNSEDSWNYYPISSNQFPGYSYGVIAEAKKYSITPLKTDNYVLVNTYENRLATKTEGRDMKNMYVCNSSISKCTQVDIEDGWYVSGQPGYEAIACKKESCSMIEAINRSCTGEGDFVYSDGYNICILKDKSVTKFKLSENIGKVAQLTHSKIVFPNDKSYIVVNSNSVKGIGYRDEETGSTPSGITICKSYSSATGVCVKSDGKILEENEYCLLGTKIYANTTESGVKYCGQKYTTGVSVEVFYGSELFSDYIKKNSQKTTIYGTQMYYCKDGNCRLTSGYKKYGSFYKCNYGSCEKASSNSQCENGELATSTTLKTTDGNVAISSNKYYYISGSNNFPGAESYKSFIVEMGSDYAVPFKGNGYYLVSNKAAILSIDPKETGYTAEKTGNKLYLCNDTDNNCIIVSKEQGNLVENKYYKNAASSDPSKKAIIGCYNTGDYKTNCVIADEESIVFDEDFDKCTKTGVLVRKTSEADSNGKITFGEYMLCVEKDKAPVSISESTTKYYMLTLTRGDSFAGVALKDDDSYNDKTRSIMLEVGNGFVSQYEHEGFILYNPTGKEVIDNLGNNRGSLYYCKRSINYTGDTKYSYACEAEKKIYNGWYFNEIYGEKRVIRCVDNPSSCVITEVKEGSECEYSGSLIYNKGFKVCQTRDKQIDISNVSNDYQVIMTVTLLNEFPGMKTNNTEIILSVKSNSVYQIKMATNLVVNDDNTVITNDAIGNLYECYEDGHCDINMIPNDNYYVKKNNEGKAVELVKCENRKCKLIADSVNGVSEGFYVSANTKNPLIQCVIPGEINNDGEFVKSGIAECKEKEFKEGWFKNSGSDNRSYPLIKCSKESGCVGRTVKEGWYINAGANSVYSKMGGVYNPIIKCENNSCNYITEELGSKCKKGGEVISPSNGNYKLCKDADSQIDFSKSGNVQIINNESSKIAVNVSSTDITNAEDAYYYIDGIMYECIGTCTQLNGDDKNGIYVFDKLTSMLMNSVCSNGSCSWTSIKNEGNYFLDDSKYLITNKENTNINEIYECIKGQNNKNIICSEVLLRNTRGYFINNEIKDQEGKNESILYLCEGVDCSIQENIPKCTELSYKKNHCFISYLDEADYDEFTNISGGSICINGNNKYLALSEINTGIDNVNCMLMPTDNNNYYYKVNKSGINNIYLQNKYGARIVYTVNSLVNGLNTSSVISTKDSNNGIILEDNGNYIVCNDGKCELTKMASCTYTLSAGKCTVSTGSVNAGQLCLSSEGNIYFALEKVTTSGGKCVNHSTSWSFSVGSDTVEPNYSNAAYASRESVESTWFVVDGKIYEIEKDNDIYQRKGSVYLIDSANKKVNIAEGKKVDISKDSQFKLYICNGQGCKIKNTCNNGINYEYIFDLNKGKVIQCDPSTNTVTYINGEGYYLNTSMEDVIKCVNGVCIELDSDVGMEGYYYDAGNAEKIIKCIRSGTSFKCVNEDIIECTYVAKEGTCVSTVDLKRNSYCIYINRVKGKIIGKPVMLYVENFIRANDSGKCISNEGSDEYYYHYRKSKFLDNEERDEILRFSKGAIVSIYEKDIGYYIITTDTRKGLTENVKLNKSRMYECTATGCVEQRSPTDDKIYVNKASSEKMVRYHSGGKYWEVMKRHCVKSKLNVRQCELPIDNIGNGDIIYLFEDGDLNPTFLASNVKLNTRSTLIKENNDDVDNTKYQYFARDRKMYILNSNKQSFDIVNESGRYFFKQSGNYHNLETYKSTVNSTDASKVQVYSYYGGWSVANTFSFNNFKEGYYWNKADLQGEGIAIQIMNVPKKTSILEEEENLRKRDDSDESVENYKAVINKCVSVKKGSCSSAQDGKSLAKGDVCVVVDGEFKGLYLVTDTVNKNGGNNNCLRYDSGIEYMYVGGSYEFSGEPLKKTVNNAIEFAGQPLVKTIISVDEQSISAFDENTRFGYYVIEKNDKSLLKSATSIDATGYYCGWEYDPFTEGDNAGENNPETKRFECNPVKATNKYYYAQGGNSVVYAKSDTKWNVESKRGYYFFNEEFEAATVKKDENEKEIADTIIYSKGVSRPGTYINSASDSVVVVENDSSNRKSIKVDYKLCQVTGDTCKSVANDVELSNGEVCYASNKSNTLYLVVVTELENSTKKYNCYTGSEKVKYRYVNNMLYKLDGLSVQEVVKGYYILNKNWEEFSATYPEVPAYVFTCDGSRCSTDPIEVNSEVIVNAAGTGNNRLLRYYSDSSKFVNVFKPGYYLLTSNSEVSKASGTYSVRYYLDESGELKELPESFKYNNIYINNALEGALTRGYSEFENSKVALNTKTGLLEYEGKAITDEEVKYLFINGILYKQKPYHFEEVDNGLYAIKDNAAFVSTEWTSLAVGTDICYYTSGGCDNSVLNSLKNGRYTINDATKNPSVIEYNSSNGNWRMVDDDGVYFFFEERYAINPTDRRISRVFEVLEGESIEITGDMNRLGYYKFNNLNIESNGKNGWEDATVAVATVEVKDKRICNSYETGEIIDTNKFCNSDELGVCIPKSSIENGSDSNNCVFSDGKSIFYFLVDNQLYSISSQAFRIIKRSGLYIVSSNKKIFEDKLESRAVAYGCTEEECKIESELATGYYLNMANGGLDDPAILYYDSTKKTWRKTADNGYYLFNSKGYAVADGEDVAFAYKVEENGNEVYSVINENEKGSFINQSSGDDNIIVEFSTKWEKAKKVPSCTISNGKVTTSEEMKVGDICLDNKKMVVISGIGSNKKRDNEYIGITAEGKEKKYSYSSENQSIVKLEDNNMVKLDVTGYVVIDKNTNMELESTEAVDAEVYKCTSGKCSNVDVSGLEVGTYLINVIGEENPLVKLAEEGQWKIESEQGYYFFKSDSKSVGNDDIVGNAVEVEQGDDGEVIQRDITTSDELGFYINKATTDEIIVSNDVSFWSKGSTIHPCNVTTLDEGIICRTMKQTLKETLDIGDYCYDNENLKLYLLIAEASSEVSEPNCIAGSNEEPLFVTPEKASTINERDVGTKLIRLTDDSIKVVSPGIYVINENGTVVDNNNEGEIELQVYICNEDGCDVEKDMEANVKFLSETGEIFEFDENGVLTKITDEGIYFFKGNGIACTSEGDVVSTIIQLSNVDETLIKEEIELDELSAGVYINSANVKSVGVYDGENWTIEESECKYDDEKKGCTSDSSDLEVGSFCVVNGKIYIINMIDEESEVNKCVPGNDEVPLYFMDDESKLMIVKEKSVSVVNDDGYYAINAKNNEALKSETPVAVKFYKCEVGLECKEWKPEKSSNYLNKAVENSNIVKFNEKGSLKEATTIETHCTIDGNSCTAVDGTLDAGDICVAENSLYLVKDDKQCVMAETYVERYQFVNKKMYKLVADTVVQKFDGYYFVDGDSRAITNVEDYSNPDVVAYMCSVKGDCIEIVPSGERYYKDYTTIVDGKFKVVKYDPEKVSKREESSGYAAITEGGIYRLDDGSYAECELESSDEVSCKDIDEVGTKVTINGEIILCSKENKSIVCVQATEGGYYLIDDTLMDCSANEEGDQLNCEEVKKEGYFLADGKDNLYECVEKVEEVNISKIMDGLNGYEEFEETDVVDDNENENENDEEIVNVNKRQNQEEESKPASDNSPANVSEQTPTTPADALEEPKGPVDVICTEIKCNEGTIVNSGGENSVDLYICKKIEKSDDTSNENENAGEDDEENDENEEEEEEEEEFEWISKDCDTGNFLKKNDNYYECEEKKENIKEEYIEKPNNDKTATEQKPITKKTTTTTTTTEEATTTTSTSTTSQKTTEKTTEKTTAKPTTSSQNAESTTTSTTTTTTKTSTTTTTSTSPTQPSGSSLRSVPSMALMMVILLASVLLMQI